MNSKQEAIKDELQRRRNNGQLYAKSRELAEHLEYSVREVGCALTALGEKGIVSQWSQSGDNITWLIELDRQDGAPSATADSYTPDKPQWVEKFEDISEGEPAAWLRDQYIEQECSLTNIAERADTTTHWVKKGLRALDIEIRAAPHKDPDAWERRGSSERMVYVGDEGTEEPSSDGGAGVDWSTHLESEGGSA